MQVFGRLLWGMDPFEALEDEDIRTAIANANGTLIHLLIYTTCTPQSYTSHSYITPAHTYPYSYTSPIPLLIYTTHIHPYLYTPIHRY